MYTVRYNFIYFRTNGHSEYRKSRRKSKPTWRSYNGKIWEWVGELLNAARAQFVHVYHAENKLCFDEMVMLSALY